MITVALYLHQVIYCQVAQIASLMVHTSAFTNYSHGIRPHDKIITQGHACNSYFYGECAVLGYIWFFFFFSYAFTQMHQPGDMVSGSYNHKRFSEVCAHAH